GGPGSAAPVGPQGMDAGGAADPPGGADLLYQPGASDGLSLLPSQGVANRFGAGGIGLQDRGRATAQGSGDALGRGRGRCAVPLARPVPQRADTVGGLLGAQLSPPTAHLQDAYPAAAGKHLVSGREIG